MGGWGSGRRYGERDTTEGYRALDVRYLQRNGVLEMRSLRRISWTNRGEVTGFINLRPSDDYVTLIYKTRSGAAEKWESQEYDVPVERTPCHYGGERVWFLCPVVRCRKRVAILYGGRIFACRHCHQLAYPSQNESPSERGTARAWALRERCGDYGSLFDPLPLRPKGMHQQTYTRLANKYQNAIRASFAGGRVHP